MPGISGSDDINERMDRGRVEEIEGGLVSAIQHQVRRFWEIRVKSMEAIVNQWNGIGMGICIAMQELSSRQ
jgi:hypothetical protein